MATIKDVARQVGLSVTTVSRALNNYDDVAEGTRQRIQQAAVALDYHPNVVARSLQGSQTNTVGLLIPTVLHRAYHAFWSEFIGGAAASCARRGVDLLIGTSDTRDEPGHHLQRLVRGQRVDGLLLCDIRCDDSRIAYLHRRHLPFVAFGRTVGGHDYPYVDVDGTVGVRLAIEHLVGLGHRHIAYLGLDPAFGFSHFRFQGYLSALDRAGLRYDASLALHGLHEDEVEGALLPLLTRPQRPTAIFATADYLALVALQVARSVALHVPNDLSVAVFDDNLLVQHADPALTAISQPNYRLGEEAVDLLIDRVTDPARPPAQRLLVPSLIVRASTRPPP